MIRQRCPLHTPRSLRHRLQLEWIQGFEQEAERSQAVKKVSRAC